MKIGITSEAYPDYYGIEPGFARMKAHGYDCVDYQGLINAEDPIYRLPESAFCKKLTDYRKMAENAGICVWQIHAPWQWPAVMDTTQEDREYQLLFYAKAVRGAAYLGAEYFAVHHIMPQGDTDTDPNLIWRVNTDFFGQLADVAKAYNVTLCLENMPFGGQCLAHPQALLDFVKKMDHSHIKICLDTGHSMVLGMQPAEAVRLIGKDYLKILHVHDNDGVKDRHWLPYEGITDWCAFADSLKEIGYDGCFSLETSARIQGLSPQEAEKSELALVEFAKNMMR